jgi:hypothetical protein
MEIPYPMPRLGTWCTSSIRDDGHRFFNVLVVTREKIFCCIYTDADQSIASKYRARISVSGKVKLSIAHTSRVLALERSLLFRTTERGAKSILSLTKSQMMQCLIKKKISGNLSLRLEYEVLAKNSGKERNSATSNSLLTCRTINLRK